MRPVPDYISLYPQSAEVAPFAGAMRPLCDRKEVSLTDESQALVKFYLFSSTHLASHYTGLITDDFTSEFDPFSPMFGEKFAPAYLPVSLKDWTGNETSRVYSDQFGAYNGLSYSTWEVDPPNPTGYGPTMMVTCMNDAGAGTSSPWWDPAAVTAGTTSKASDPFFQQGYSQFCYELPFMPSQTGYFDTPVVPTSAFSEGFNHPDCDLADTTPAIKEVDGDGVGPWVSATGARTLSITALGDLQVDNYAYSGPNVTLPPYNQQKIQRHYGFGTAPGTAGKVELVANDGTRITLGTSAAGAWSDTSITATIPALTTAQTTSFACPITQQAQYGGSAAQCGQLVITAANGKQSVDTVTVTIGGKAPKRVPADYPTIQKAIDLSSPGDLVIVAPGIYNELVLMWKPVRLQGVGAASSIIDANAQPAGKLLSSWRVQLNCLMGLTIDGRPRAANDNSCATGWNFASGGPNTGATGRNFKSMIVDRLPFEAALGWDASLNGNLAEQLIEPSLMGAYEGAGITVLAKGVRFPNGTTLADAFGQTTGAAFPDGSTLLTSTNGTGLSSSGTLSTGDNNSICRTSGTVATNPFPSNFVCNPSSIDGLGIHDSSQGGGGIFVHAYAHYLQVANNRVSNNQGTMGGGMTIGLGEHADVQLAGAAVAPLNSPGSCSTQTSPTNLGLPFCYNLDVNVHNNDVTNNSSMGDELFSSTPAGAGGANFMSGADYYKFTGNFVCGNMSTGDGGGFAHVGFSNNGRIEHNTIVFNQSTNPTITTNGGGLLIMGAPDTDPTTCGLTTDVDCVPPPGSITPSDGAGRQIMVNANLVLGNSADAGSGGGVRLQHVNGTDVVNIPNPRTNSCGSNFTGTSCWNSVNLTNNIIVNNVAGWDGGGMSLQDTLLANIVNNTIAANDTTASAGDLFTSLFAPLASAPATTCFTGTGSTGSASCPQPAGLVSVHNSLVLQANVGLRSAARTDTAAARHGRNLLRPIRYRCCSTTRSGRTAPFYISPRRSARARRTSSKWFRSWRSRHRHRRRRARQTPVSASGPRTNYWEIGVRGDTSPTNHSGGSLAPAYSLMSSTTGYAATNRSATLDAAVFTSQYCNGSRSPPEAGLGGLWQVPPGTNETNALPTPVFSLAPAATVDEGNNWINMKWGPLTLTNPVGGASLGDFHPAASSPVIDAGVSTAQSGFTPPSTDYYGTTRSVPYDIGAVEGTGGGGGCSVTVSPTSVPFGSQADFTTSSAHSVTVHNGCTTSVSGGAFTPTAPFSRATLLQGGAGTCGGTLAAGASCTVNVVFSPTTVGTVNGTLTVAYTATTVAGSPVALSGTGTANGLLSFTSATNGTLGNVPILGTRSLTFTIPTPRAAVTSVVTVTNTGTGPLAITAESITLNAALFSITANTCSFTTALAPAATCTMSVRYATPATRPFFPNAGAASVTNNGATGPATPLVLLGQ